MRLRNSLGAVAYVQFAKDVADVPFNSVYCKHQFVRDFFICCYSTIRRKT